MPPPPIPIDPALDTINTLDINLPSGIGDQFFQPGPVLPKKLQYSGTSTHIGTFLQDVQLPAMRQPDLDTNPMSRFQNDQGPWTAQNVGGDLTQHSQAPRYQGSYGSNYAPVTLQSQYREPPRSEQGSSTTGRHPVDSGYGSRSLATKSVRSVEPIDQSQSCQSLIGDVNDMRVYPDEHFSPHLHGHVLPFPNEAPYPYSLPTTEPPEPPPTLFVCPYPECHNHQSKNLSESRYVHCNMQYACSS